jgi:glutathione S-transferase
MELYQAEWCPHSHRVRQRMTELGLDFRARQVPAEKGDRHALDRDTGTRAIPVLVAFGEIVRGADEILAWLKSASPSSRTRAATARRRGWTCRTSPSCVS